MARTKRIKDRPIIARMRDVLRQAEQDSTTGGTGATIIKLAGSPLARLIEGGKIGPAERMAADDIATAFEALTSRLRVRGQCLERVDPSHGAQEPARVTDAIRRYQSWATHWSMKAKQGDKTLQVVIAAIIDERAFSVIEADIGIRHGLASRATVRGLRDYAARAGDWVSHRIAAQWKLEAGNTFQAHTRALSLAVAKARLGDSE